MAARKSSKSKPGKSSRTTRTKSVSTRVAAPQKRPRFEARYPESAGESSRAGSERSSRTQRKEDGRRAPRSQSPDSRAGRREGDENDERVLSREQIAGQADEDRGPETNQAPKRTSRRQVKSARADEELEESQLNDQDEDTGDEDDTEHRRSRRGGPTRGQESGL